MKHRSMFTVATAPDSTATATPAGHLPTPPRSAGHSACPQCGEKWDQFAFTPSGLCLVCAALGNTIPIDSPISDPFWLLTPEEIERAEGEMHRLNVEIQRLTGGLPAGDWGKKEGPLLDRIGAVEREAFLLHLLYAASRQFRR